MTYDADRAYELVKARLDYICVPATTETYLRARIEAAAKRLEQNGIRLRDTTDDLMLLCDMAVWEFQSRDKPGAMPEWLKIVRRERWLADRKANAEVDGDAP